MVTHHTFDALSQVIEQLERQGRSVRHIETTGPDATGALEVSVTIPVSLCTASGATTDPTVTPERAALSESGGFTVTVSAPELLPELAAAETVTDIDEQAVDVVDGQIVVTVGFRVQPTVSAAAATTTADDVSPAEEQPSDATGAGNEDTAGSDEPLAARLLAARADDVPADNPTDEPESRDGTEENAEAVDESGGDTLTDRLKTVRSDDVPAYEDADYLRLLYESCGTFTEMSDRIEMDVAAETVRRYMIEADIHEPRSYDTDAHDSSDSDRDDATEESVSVPGDADSSLESAGPEPSPSASEEIADEQFVTDGIGLPEGVNVEDIVDAVVDATAVYEVQRSLDLGHDETHDLLRQLNVLDLVLHRVDEQPAPVSKNDVVQRIRQCDAGAA